MRKIILAVLSAFAFIAVSCSSASKVGYSHRPLAAEGCSVNYSVIRQNEELFIIATVTSDSVSGKSSFYRTSQSVNIRKIFSED